MYRTYHLTSAEDNKIVRSRWDGDTTYYDVFEDQEELEQEEARLQRIDEEYKKQKEAYLNSLKVEAKTWNVFHG